MRSIGNKEANFMTNTDKMIADLRQAKPEFDDAYAIVEMVRKVGDMLERMRQRKNWSQSDLAERLGISAGRVSQLESGTLRDAPSLKMLARFAKACGETIGIVASGDQATILEHRAAQTNSAIVGELSELRGEVKALREIIQANIKPQQEGVWVGDTFYVGGQEELWYGEKIPYGSFSRGKLNAATFEGLKVATEKVLKDAGFTHVQVSAAPPSSPGYIGLRMKVG
jgi:transcriptional regulator with XRE-family HTH domain